MKRLHLWEIQDQEWCPRCVRDAVTDYLQFVMSGRKPYAPVVPILASALRRADSHRVLDLCSGAAGPWHWLHPRLAELGMNVSVCLTDKYPNAEAFEQTSHRANRAIRYCSQPVDATQIPAELSGFRTLFTAFHHFRPDDARAVLADAVARRQGIGIFETTHRRPLALGLMFLVPVLILFSTPFIRPFRWSRLLWTYVIPLVPLVTLFDGLVSCLRTYSQEELLELTRGIAASGFQWEVGLLKSEQWPLPIIYLIGVPMNAPAHSSAK